MVDIVGNRSSLIPTNVMGDCPKTPADLELRNSNFNLQWLDFLGITSISYKIVRPDKEKTHANVMHEYQKICYATD